MVRLRHFPCPGPFPVSVATLSLCLAFSLPRAARAENGLSYRYEDYSEADGRIEVTTQSALLEQHFNPDTSVKVGGVLDAIAGATPTGQPAPAGSDQVVLTEMDERREAWNANFLHQFSVMGLDVGIAQSSESDYDSLGWSLNTNFAFNEKNTTVTAGAAGTDDDVKVFYQADWATKENLDFILGVNQLLNPLTSVTLNFTAGQATGYLSDQYKLVQKSVEVAPGIFLPFTYGENRPDERNRWALFLQLNRSYPQLKGAVEASYRFYHDSFGTDSHTIELAWFQRVGASLVIQPFARFYDQSAADFYYYNLDATDILPASGAPDPDGPFYSSDYRLSQLRTYTYGLKAIWTISGRWQLNASVSRYDMHGRDGVTPDSAYPRATLFAAGLKLTW